MFPTVTLLILWKVFYRFPFFDHEGSEEKVETKDAKNDDVDGIVACMIVDDARKER